MGQVIFITGANRGIGKGLAAHYLGETDTTVIAAIRNVSEENTKELRSLPKGSGSQLILVPLSLDIPSSAAEAIAEIQTQHHIEHIDIVLANAGICNHWGPVVDMTDEDVLSHFEVNTLGPLRLFRAIAPLLLNASQPKFVYTSTLLASLDEIERIPSMATAYGMSKVAGNYLVRKIEAENPKLIALLVDPGLVQTDMGSRNAQFIGLEKAPLTVQDTVQGIIKQVKGAQKSTSPGQFVNYLGEKVPW
ncbi:hypothetical protein BDV32DRAFT_16194 [Aspergillus pseudonomiae]|uniref:Uncharacterized protein n=1 Tax=Aspergillus pseudonomiae TaxID=1506151 RepID=A0A5N6HLZ4_9EURO|nr:uncharacterized protein BDV37DRAFT_261548 [Aspergillus pseudonomiae]KAB8254370.1 hypothetical protein BDV32DRAFT_16194 [Aspergillus pseudonomiae]KAE8399130.1 hypothetical protein BDV37DRAFT_261548 [Aspergillus pseudonomiae]